MVGDSLWEQDPDDGYAYVRRRNQGVGQYWPDIAFSTWVISLRHDELLDFLGEHCNATIAAMDDGRVFVDVDYALPDVIESELNLRVRELWYTIWDEEDNDE